jgi:hypothetical protein
MVFSPSALKRFIVVRVINEQLNLLLSVVTALSAMAIGRSEFLLSEGFGS